MSGSGSDALPNASGPCVRTWNSGPTAARNASCASDIAVKCAVPCGVIVRISPSISSTRSSGVSTPASIIRSYSWRVHRRICTALLLSAIPVIVAQSAGPANRIEQTQTTRTRTARVTRCVVSRASISLRPLRSYVEALSLQPFAASAFIRCGGLSWRLLRCALNNDDSRPAARASLGDLR